MSAARWLRSCGHDGAILGDVAASEPPHGPLPHALAVRIAIRQLLQRVPEYIDDVVGELRGHVLRHFQTLMAALDERSKRDLAEERRRIELAVGPPDAVTAGHTSVELEELQQLVTRSAALRDALLRGEALQSAMTSTAAHEPTPTTQPSEADVEARPQNEPARAITGTCPICAVASDAVYDFLCHYQYAISHDVATQQQFVASQGLCPTHTWHLERLSSPRGLSLGYPPLLDRIEQRVHAIASGPLSGAAGALRDLEADTATCPACLARRKAEQRAAERFVQSTVMMHRRLSPGRIPENDCRAHAG